MKKILSFLMIALIFSACTKDNIEPINEDIALEENINRTKEVRDDPTDPVCGEAVVYTLSGLENFVGGTVTVTNDTENLYVTFESAENWYILRTGLYVGSESGIPETGGVTANYPYFSSSRAETSRSYTIPLANLGECFVISAAVKVSQLDSEGNGINYTWAYITDIPFGDNVWDAFGEYCVQDCEEECFDDDTAWSFGTTFTSLTGTTRWGWYSEYTVGQANEYTIYAGQTNDIGTLYVSDDGVILTVTYETDGGAVMGVAHLYVGNVVELEEDYMNKKGTPVPGHFPYSEESDPYTDNFTFEIPLDDINFDGVNLIIAAHAESYMPCEEE